MMVSQSIQMSTVVIFMSLSVCVAGHTILVHYSRTQPGPKYAISTVVLLTEVLKFMGGLTMMLRDHRWRCKTFLRTLCSDVIINYVELLKTAIPSIIYAFQNNLVIISLANLDAATFQLTSQLKILWTAFFMWRLLRRQFSSRQRLALVLLCVGEILVHYDMALPVITSAHKNETVVPCASRVQEAVAHTSDPVHRDLDPTSQDIQNHWGRGHQHLEHCEPRDFAANNLGVQQSYALGLLAALGTCVGSGFAGVYLEMMLKKSPVCSFWVRNTQLYLSGVVINGFITTASHWNKNGLKSIFNGFNEMTMCFFFVFASLHGFVVMSALVGFFTAFVIQRLDNIWKNLASSASVVMATLGSVILFGTPIGLVGIVGTSMVILVPWLNACPCSLCHI